jgi:hypothetical protein
VGRGRDKKRKRGTKKRKKEGQTLFVGFHEPLS